MEEILHPVLFEHLRLAAAHPLHERVELSLMRRVAPNLDHALVALGIRARSEAHEHSQGKRQRNETTRDTRFAQHVCLLAGQNQNGPIYTLLGVVGRGFCSNNAHTGTLTSRSADA